LQKAKAFHYFKVIMWINCSASTAYTSTESRESLEEGSQKFNDAAANLVKVNIIMLLMYYF